MKTGADLQLVVADLLSHTPADAYDVVGTHSLLPTVEAEQRWDVVRRWRSWLSPGGRVVTVARVAGDAAQASPAAFAATVRERAAPVLGPLGVDPDELAEAALRYGSTTVVYPFRSPDEVGALFEEAGFTIEHLECVTVDGPVGDEAAHPGTAQTGSYAGGGSPMTGARAPGAALVALVETLAPYWGGGGGGG